MIDPKKLTHPQRLALERAARKTPGYEHTGWTPYGASGWGLADRLVRAGLLQRYEDERGWSHGYVPTDAGLAALGQENALEGDDDRA